MKRLRIACLHFRLFRNQAAWWWGWSLIWVFQFLSALTYSLHGDPFRVADRMMTGILLLAVFHMGNFYSERNNGYLRTLPLPRGTCFWVDAVFPLLLFIGIPLLREIPPVLQSGFSIADLAWAWLDLLLLYVPLVLGVWQLGALLSPICTPPRLAGHLFGLFGLYWFMKQILPAFTEVTSFVELFGQGISNDQRYFTVFLGAWGGGLLALAGVRMRLEARKAVIFTHSLLFPLLLFWLLTGPAWIQKGRGLLELHRPLPEITTSGWELFPVTALSEKSDVWQGTFEQARWVQHYRLPLLARHENEEFEALMQLERARIRVEEEETWFPLEVSDSPPVFGMHNRLLHHWAGDQIYLLNFLRSTQRRPYEFQTLGIQFQEETLPDFQGQAVEMAYDLRVTPHQLEAFAVDQPLSRPHRQRRGAENLHLHPTKISWSFPSGQEGPRFQFEAGASMRVESLHWKSLIFGERPGPVVLLILKNTRSQPHAGLSAHHYFREVRNSGAAFPRARARIGSMLNLEMQGVVFDHELGGFIPQREDDPPPKPEAAFCRYFMPETSPGEYQVDWLVLRPRNRYRIQLRDYHRFSHLPERGRIEDLFNPRSSEHGPPGTWETDMLRRWSTEPLGGMIHDGSNRLFYGLGLTPALEYREALFEAAKLHPRLSAIILGNGWEEEALEVWLDLARQGGPLPAAARLAFQRSGDQRLLEALEVQERWAPLEEEK